ncbi:MAG: M24 family metallopeptidase [Anaerolineales bacterium]|nr:M24 family metallopeptidase [Anaerolineales bacterium]
MKQDLDRLMRERNLDAMVVMGRLNGNPPLYYMANGAKIIRARVIKKMGKPAILICAPIDREEAAMSGLKVVTTNHFDYEGILRKTPDILSAEVELLRNVFEEFGISGKVGFYGFLDQGMAYKLISTIKEKLEVDVYGEYEPNLIDIARATKDVSEVEKIIDVGKRSSTVMGDTLEFLKSHAIKNNYLVDKEDKPLTIGRVHQQIHRFLAENQLDVPEGIIFSIGRDAGIPHNKGNPTDIVELGKSIIFDFGTREAGGGYYFDMTRTFCLEYAPPEIEKAYQDVYDCIHLLIGAYKVGNDTCSYMQMACNFLESRGHPTLGSNTKNENGFATGLGHGIGLAVHEQPFFSLSAVDNTVIQPGHVFTCEPGVYYPERGFGVRLEDVIWINPDGRVNNLCDFPKELVVKISK